MTRLSIAAMVLTVFATSRLEAAVIVPADLSELVAESRAIVHGRVIAAESRAADGPGGVETHVTLAAEDYLKGNLGPRVTLRVPGGQLGDLRTVVMGAPVLKPGDDVVLFLGGSGPALPWIVGLNQGAYRVRSSTRRVGAGRLDDDLTVERMIHTVHSSASGPSERVPLTAFKARVRSFAAEGGAR